MPKQTVPFTVEGQGTGVPQQLTVVGAHSHTFASDTYPAFGGADAAPSPLSYTLGALTSCNQISAQLVAKEVAGALAFLTRWSPAGLSPRSAGRPGCHRRG